MTRGLAVAGLLATVVSSARAQIVGPGTGGAATLAQAERMLGHTKRVLMIAAHPDDEDTELLTYLVRREGAVAGYLSLTRGEGGQNLIGPELGEALGLIRTEELLAARSLDGARQFFTRAFDFGYSKTIEETFTFWPRDSLLKDVVRIVRRFRPQIVLSIFSGTPRDGHGQHQAAGWAAAEAFEAAGDPDRFPELEREEGLTAWRPLKLYRSARFDTTGANLVLDGGILDPEIGQSYHQIAMRGRSLHRSQDMGVLQEIGPSPIRLALLADRTGRGPTLFAGVDTTSPRAGTPAAVELAGYRAEATAIRAGLVVDAIADQSRLVAGGSVEVRLSVWNTGAAAARIRAVLAVPDGWTATGECLGIEALVASGAVHHCRARVAVPAQEPVTTPYFLRLPRDTAFYRWSGRPEIWGEPFEPPVVVARFEVAGPDLLVLTREVVHRFRDQATGEVRRPLAVVPRVGVTVTPTRKVWPLGYDRPQPVTVTLTHAGSDTTSGTVSLDLPPGWPPVEPLPFRLSRPDERRALVFTVRPPRGLAAGELQVRAIARDQAGRRYQEGLVAVGYSHIHPRGFPIPSTMAVRAAPLALPSGKRIGYIRGAADVVPEALAGVGLAVEVFDDAMLERGELRGFDVIVIGSRAYETNQTLVENNGRLLDYVRQGGHLVVQYQQHPFFRGGFAPYRLAVAGQHDRVTDERAPVRLLRPDDPAFRAPNRLTAADWDGWVQERGLYFASDWDARYTPLLETADPGGKPLQGGLLLGQMGQGTYLYSGLAFFRQLPAGVPGAFRLFLNLLDLEPRAAVP